MRAADYIKDHMFSIACNGIGAVILLLLFLAFHAPVQMIAASFVVWIVLCAAAYARDYMRRKTFYDELLRNLERLDQKYLILETLNRPDFYDGRLLCDAMYEVNKSMLERIRGKERELGEFKEYVEMWIHEIKLPISSLVLMTHNTQTDRRFAAQLKRLEDCAEQVLYYMRSETAENDYLIKENRLSRIIGSVALRNKDDLLEKQIDLLAEKTEASVCTDAKWLEFILNQLVNNSVKYADPGKEKRYIRVYVTQGAGEKSLHIEDNGIGICESDLPRVFEKSFTGENGRTKSASSTGMGLYIAKNLCGRLGHEIGIESVKGESTHVWIRFGEQDLYEVLNAE